MTALTIRNSINRSPLRCDLLLILLALAVAWVALLPTAAAVNPPPDGGYPSANTAEGEDALFSLTTGFANTAIGLDALYSNTTGSYNTANGYEALYNNATGSYNTASGALALALNTTGNSNTANGFEALYSNAGSANTAIGHIALFRNTTGTDNTASGFEALDFNTTGSRNVATGSNALYSNQTGGDNTATGVNALYYNTGNYNTAHGYQTLESNTTGTTNTANGLNALNLNTTGSYNAANGAYALYKNTLGSRNIALGYNAGYSLTTGSNNIEIGNSGLAAEANTIRIGAARTQTNTYIAGISGVTVAGGVGVIVDTNGHLGTVVSSARFKHDVHPMDTASEAILSLQPVTFHYKHELDPADIPQFGLIAEQVEKVSPDLVAHDEQGKPYSVRYEAVNSMLLNEFLKEHRNGQEQDATISQLKSTLVQQHNDFQSALADQQKQITALTTALQDQAAQIQKVSVQLVADKKTSYVVVNDR
jgi:hypothetical protein